MDIFKRNSFNSIFEPKKDEIFHIENLNKINETNGDNSNPPKKVKIKKKISKKTNNQVSISDKTKVENFNFNQSDQKYNISIDNTYLKSKDLVIAHEVEVEKNFKLEEKNKETFIIDKISQKCIYFRNHKSNLQKILLEQGTKIIIEKLDIMNLFNKLIIVEKLENNIRIEDPLIEMSNECKYDIYNIRKNPTNLK